MRLLVDGGAGFAGYAVLGLFQQRGTTQLPYAMTAAAVSFVAYIIAGFIRSWLICLPIGIVLMVGTLLIIRAAANKNGK